MPTAHQRRPTTRSRCCSLTVPRCAVTGSTCEKPAGTPSSNLIRAGTGVGGSWCDAWVPVTRTSRPARAVDAPRVVRAQHERVVAPALDDAQRRAVEHRGGAVLVLAGPGTGKTTTIVEAVVQRVERTEITPDQALVCLLYTSPSPRDRQKSRMPSSA